MSLVGRLEDLALADILQILSIGKKTGILTIRGDSESAFIVFRNGLIVRAEANLLDGNLGRDMVRYHLVKEKVLDLAMEVKKKLPDKPIAEILLELGSVSREQVEKAAKKRIEKTIAYLMAVSSGDFRFEQDTVTVGADVAIADTGWEISKGLSAQYLLMEGARVYDEQMGQQSMGDDLGGEESGEFWEEEETGAETEERKDISALRSLTQELRFPSSASEVTLLILRFASDIFERGVLFMVGDHEFAGLGQFGLEIERADEKIRETIIPYTESPFLRRIVAAGQPHRSAVEKDRFTETLLREIGGGWPPEAGFFPIIAENKVVALLYCDNAGTGADFAETEGLEIFINQAGLALEKSLLQKKIQEMQRGMKQP